MKCQRETKTGLKMMEGKSMKCDIRGCVKVRSGGEKAIIRKRKKR